MSFTATDYPSGALVGSGKHNVTLSGSAVPDGMLLFASLGGTETVGELFTYSIKLKTPDILNLGYVSPAANLPLKQMVGKDLCVNIELDGGGKRYISGLVTAARVAGHQGRSVLYELRIEPWLKILTHTSDYKAFQNKNVVDNALPHPVNAATGAKYLADDDDFDFNLPGHFPLEWQRVYSSRDERTQGMFGQGWSVMYEVSLERTPGKP